VCPATAAKKCGKCAYYLCTECSLAKLETSTKLHRMQPGCIVCNQASISRKNFRKRPAMGTPTKAAKTVTPTKAPQKDTPTKAAKKDPKDTSEPGQETKTTAKLKDTPKKDTPTRAAKKREQKPKEDDLAALSPALAAIEDIGAKRKLDVKDKKDDKGKKDKQDEKVEKKDKKDEKKDKKECNKDEKEEKNDKKKDKKEEKKDKKDEKKAKLDVVVPAATQAEPLQGGGDKATKVAKATKAKALATGTEGEAVGHDTKSEATGRPRGEDKTTAGGGEAKEVSGNEGDSEATNEGDDEGDHEGDSEDEDEGDEEALTMSLADQLYCLKVVLPEVAFLPLGVQDQLETALGFVYASARDRWSANSPGKGCYYVNKAVCLSLRWECLPKGASVPMRKTMKLLQQMFDDDVLELPEAIRGWRIGVLSLLECPRGIIPPHLEQPAAGTAFVIATLHGNGSDSYLVHISCPTNPGVTMTLEVPCRGAMYAMFGAIMFEYMHSVETVHGKLALRAGLFPPTAPTPLPGAMDIEDAAQPIDMVDDFLPGAMDIEDAAQPIDMVDDFEAPDNRSDDEKDRAGLRTFSMEYSRMSSNSTLSFLDVESYTEWGGERKDERIVDIDRLRQKLISARPALTKLKMHEIVMQATQHEAYYFGVDGMRDLEPRKRNNILMDIKEATPVAFKSDGFNCFCEADAAAGMGRGNLVVVPLALGTHLEEALQASADAFEQYQDSAVVNWAQQDELGDRMKKLVLSTEGKSMDFPTNEDFGEGKRIEHSNNSKSKAARKRHAAPLASQAIVDATKLVLAHVATINLGKLGPHKAKVFEKLLKDMYHVTLSWYTGPVWDHQDLVTDGGPGPQIISNPLACGSLFVFTSLTDPDAPCRTVWLNPGDMLLFTAEMRYEWSHAVYPLFEGPVPSEWQAATLTVDSIMSARTVFVVRVGEDEPTWLHKQATQLRKQEDFDECVLPMAYRLRAERPATGKAAATPTKDDPAPKATSAKKATASSSKKQTRTPKPRAVPRTAAPSPKIEPKSEPASDNKTDTVWEFLGARVWVRAQVVMTKNQFKLTQYLEWHRPTHPIFTAGSVFVLCLPDAVPKNPGKKTRVGAYQRVRFHVLAVGELRAASTNTRVLVVMMQVPLGVKWEGPYNIQAGKMPSTDYYTMEPDQPVKGAKLPAWLARSDHPGPSDHTSRRLQHARLPADMSEEDEGDEGDEDEGDDDGEEGDTDDSVEVEVTKHVMAKTPGPRVTAGTKKKAAGTKKRGVNPATLVRIKGQPPKKHKSEGSGNQPPPPPNLGADGLQQALAAMRESAEAREKSAEAREKTASATMDAMRASADAREIANTAALHLALANGQKMLMQQGQPPEHALAHRPPMHPQQGYGYSCPPYRADNELGYNPYYHGSRPPMQSLSYQPYQQQQPSMHHHPQQLQYTYEAQPSLQQPPPQYAGPPAPAPPPRRDMYSVPMQAHQQHYRLHAPAQHPAHADQQHYLLHAPAQHPAQDQMGMMVARAPQPPELQAAAPRPGQGHVVRMMVPHPQHHPLHQVRTQTHPRTHTNSHTHTHPNTHAQTNTNTQTHIHTQNTHTYTGPARLDGDGPSPGPPGTPPAERRRPRPPRGVDCPRALSKHSCGSCAFRAYLN
jgi:hypothetical protein